MRRVQRRIQKPVHEVFNDGFLQYGYDTTQRNGRGKRIGEVFSSKGKLAFQELSARDEDLILASSMGASLDLKIKTRYPPSFRNISISNLKCIIEKEKYDAIKVDRDKNKRYLYFYLQKVGVRDERTQQEVDE